MAEQQNNSGGTQDFNSAKQNTYTKGLYKDFNDSYVPEGVWINAINAVTSSHSGDAGTIGNEPSNEYCTSTNFDIIGLVRREASTWFVFSTNDITSEVGIFDETSCTYTRYISASCLGFKRSNLITGVTQANYDCTYTVFWADGLNPDRAVNLDKIPWEIEKYTGTADCPIPVYFDPPRLDCDKTRLHYLIQTPCFSLQKSTSAGTLFNGSYQVAVAYSINGLRVTDYFSISNLVSIWTHENNGGSVDLEFSAIDTNFEEYEVVLISTINETTRARRVGYYSTAQTKVHIDNNNDTLIEVPLEDIPLNQTIYETSDKMFLLNFYLLRTGMRSKFDFYYQPLANQIVTKWVQAEYPADYYVRGNNETGYMRDEIYSFFIRWVYKTGDKSASYHIPGRPLKPGWDNTIISTNNPDLLPYDNAGQPAPKWKVYNTAISLGGVGTLPDGASIKNIGYMSYWESEERYPVKPNIYNSSAYTWSNITSNPPYSWSTQVNNPAHTPPIYYPDYDLCGMPIRHHKFPDDTLSQIYNDTTKTIQLLGVKFENIKPPVDSSGNVIKSIVGYEILRGSREGNRTIVAKGIINNMYEYNIPNQPTGKALYQNYPYNSLEADYYLRNNAWKEPYDPKDHDDTNYPMTSYKKDYFTFHSPEFNFRGVYLNPNEIRVYGQYYGTSYGTFVEPYGHPKHKIPSHGAFIGCLLIGLGQAIHGLLGKRTVVKGDNRSLVGGLATAAVAAAGGAGGASSAAATTALGAKGFAGEIKIGTSSGTGSNISLPEKTIESSDLNVLNPNTRKPNILAEIMSFITQVNMIITIGGFLLAQGFGNAMKALMELLPWRQYALQYNSHGFYNNYKIPIAQNYRREVKSARYIKSTVQTFDPTYLVNNLYRPHTIMFNTKGVLANPSVLDQSRKTVNQLKAWTNPNQNFSLPISSYYGGLKLDLKSAYGQLPSIVQLPISACVEKVVLTANKPQSSSVYFRGDVYINRYTEKNSFPLFNNWLFDMPDGTDFNYKFYANVPYPRYWSSFEDLDFNDISLRPSFPKLNSNPIKGILDFANKFGQFVVSPITNVVNWVTGPSKFFHLDRDPSKYGFQLQDILKKTFYIKNGYFYLFVNGVRDFYCESEINLSCRDYGAQIPEQFYNPYGYNDLYSLFRTDIIKVPEYYKYDYSLSASKVAASYVSWGRMLSREFNPDVAETCLQYYPTRMVYSLQQQYEQSRDNWRIFLANNYKDFENVVTSVKPINRTGSAILFEDATPTTINGVDELKTSTGNRITIGDGGLFEQAFQALTNADLELEYGSCQDTRSVINTPFGIFWISQRNGKIMELAGNKIIDISMNGMRAWFAENLKYSLLDSFPNYTLLDNTVKGIGCQTVYDNQYEIVYFAKRDYKLLPGIITEGPNKDIEYIPERQEFKVTAYSYNFKLSYGADPSLDIQDGYQIQGAINGYTINNCIYNSANPIGDFVSCVANAIRLAPNVEKVYQKIGSANFSLEITLKDPKIPATITLGVVNKFVTTSIPINTEDFKYIEPSDTDYFEDCSWTISYDPKVKMWISFHDWHPDLLMVSNDHFYSIKDNGFWKHNNACNSYNNYYGINHGWEIEFPVNTGTTITSIKSIEYYLEVFKYNINCVDRYHVLDGNFDQAIIYNTEQTSGLLNLHIKPKNNPVALLNYPKINLDSIDIHVAKEENKYRFNQFWDTTRDRGEFSGLEITNFITECNGYRKNLNPQAVNYAKSPLQRKKFRHYGNRLILRKLQSGPEKMNLKVVTTKETLSPR
jgi:hypothetical protein